MQAIRGLVGEVAKTDPAAVVEVISSRKAEQKIPYHTSWRALGGVRSWFYKWRNRPPTAREVRLSNWSRRSRRSSRARAAPYGSPKVFIQLARRGWRVSVNTVAKVMPELGLTGRKVRRRRSLTRPGRRSAVAGFVRRDFTTEEPDHHSVCGFKSPIDYERDYRATLAEGLAACCEGIDTPYFPHPA
ncbi:IS3 family transposase [Streptomyces shenzhenensis]|uniref:IS3 family transposase n=1 Tax=Streptomyces shenzhenensis TaxID=943815 RepID=UPI0033D89E2F